MIAPDAAPPVLPRHRRRPAGASLVAVVAAVAVAAVAAPVALSAWTTAPLAAQSPAPLPDRVEIVRTAFGVPHLRADDLEALGYGLAWVQMEDYAELVLERLTSARGALSAALGEEHIEDDFVGRIGYAEALARYHTLPTDTRKVMEGFAAGVNDWITAHPSDAPEWAAPDFTGHDVAARDVGSWSRSRARSVLRSLGLDDALVPGVPVAEEEDAHPSDGSNAWAFAPSRTRSGAAILVRNPHLAWDAGYYEAHVTIPGAAGEPPVLDFYGDFRVGGAFGIIGGFNRRLGWATTNNSTLLDQAYRLRLDQERADHIVFDGVPVPLTHTDVTVDVRSDDGSLRPVTRRFWRSPLGPVIHRDDTSVIVLKSASEGGSSRGEQFLRMMQAETLEQWKAAMRLRAMPSSNFTYADADGHILLVWNARLPAFPHPPARDSALDARTSDDIWTSLVPWDSLPAHEDPPGGYVQNANDPPHFNNGMAPLDPAALPPGVPDPRLRLRSQLSLRLAETLGDDLTLDQVIEAKHDLTMLAAERLKPDLLAATRRAIAEGGTPEGVTPEDLAAAAELLAQWDDTAHPDARGALLFDRWLRRYTAFVADSSLWAVAWSTDDPRATPRGLGRPTEGVRALAEAMVEARERWGGWDRPWGEVHRARLGAVDLPAPGCSNLAGCFRILEYREADDGLREVRRGDGWVFAVEFTDPLDARTILAYGQTNDPESPHHTDQLADFLDGVFKPALLDWTAIESAALRRYRPGR